MKTAILSLAMYSGLLVRCGFGGAQSFLRLPLSLILY
jgi:hypothetical protein